MSVEIGGGEEAPPVPICNLLFFMNPTEMDSLLHDGIFHQLEYYANAYDNPSVQRSYNTLLHSQEGSVSMVRKIQLYLQATLEWFTTTPGFSTAASARAGRPDALYIYKQWIHHVRTIQ